MTGVCSDWFEAEQGPQQGRALSLLLFLFAPVLVAVLHKDSARMHADILADLGAHLKESPTSMGPEPAMWTRHVVRYRGGGGGVR